MINKPQMIDTSTSPLQSPSPSPNLFQIENMLIKRQSTRGAGLFSYDNKEVSKSQCKLHSTMTMGKSMQIPITFREDEKKTAKIRIDKLVIKSKTSISLKKGLPMTHHTDQQTQIGHSYQNTDLSLPKIKTTPLLSKHSLLDSVLNLDNNKNEDNDNDLNHNEKKTNIGTKTNYGSIYKVKTFSKIYLGSNPLYPKKSDEEIEELKALKISNVSLLFNKYSNAKTSSLSLSSIGQVKAYAVNSYQGISRSYHEDRVSIILSITQPHGFKGIWPQCSFFAVYDGHGGNKCCDFLRDKLQDYIIKNTFFPSNPKIALYSGIEQAEKDFIKLHALDHSGELIDKSGSCAIVALLVDDICYVANVGDSRLVLSKNKGKVVSVITTDHKPHEEKETQRIEANGGKIYQGNMYSKSLSNNFNTTFNGNASQLNPNCIYRVFPGGLAVSRTIGDAEAKVPSLGGKPNVVIATPEINQFRIDEETDFFVMGSDGIFDYLSSEECVECAWIVMKSKRYSQSIHSKSGAVVDMIIKSSLKRKTTDNVTSIFVAFNSFEKVYQKKFGQRIVINADITNSQANTTATNPHTPTDTSGMTTTPIIQPKIVKSSKPLSLFIKRPSIKLKLQHKMTESSYH